MKKTYLFLLTFAMAVFFSCKSEINPVPKIDIASLKDEASILDATTKIVNAKKMDDSLQNANKNYKTHYAEIIKIQTAIIKKSHEYGQTLNREDYIKYMTKFSTIISNQ